MSKESASIMIVDDLPANQLLLHGLLEDDYEDIECHSSGMECLNALEGGAEPSLILLDLMMPEMDGLEVCEKIKSNPKKCDIPIIFVTAETAPEEKLKAYETGGDDFISKPFNHDELVMKIRASLTQRKKMEKLAKNVELSRNAAMEAITTTSELGRIVQFLEYGTQCEDFDVLGQKLLDTTQGFGVTACFQFRTSGGAYHYGNGCKDGSIEAKLLTVAQDKGRIVGEGRRVFFNTPHISMLIKNMPTHEPELCGRLKDNLLIMLNAADGIAKAIGYKEEAGNQRLTNVDDALNTFHTQVGSVREDLQAFGKDTIDVLNNIHKDFDEALFSLGLTEEQEKYLQDLFENGYEKLHTLQNKEDKIVQSFDMISQKIQKLI